MLALIPTTLVRSAPPLQGPLQEGAGATPVPAIEATPAPVEAGEAAPPTGPGPLKATLPLTGSTMLTGTQLYLPLLYNTGTVTQTAPPPAGSETESDEPAPDPVETLAPVTPTGGAVNAAAGALQLTFAPGAVADKVDIKVIDHQPDAVDRAAQRLTAGMGSRGDQERLNMSGLPLRLFSFSTHQPGTQGRSAETEVQFQAPVTVTYRYSEAEVTGLLEESLHFVTYNPQAERYEAIPSQVDVTKNIISAVLEHFSDYGVAGEQAGLGGPAIGAFEVSLAKGQASYSYDLPLPGGPNGFGPQLSLQYSSSIPNGMVNQTDTGWVGIGWMLELGRIHDSSLTLNGVSEIIYPEANNPNRFHTAHQTHLKIERFPRQLPAGVGGSCVNNAYWWRVTDQNGTQYTFGSTGPTEDGATLTHIDHSQWRHRVFKLTTVEDVYGNKMTISYTNSSPIYKTICGRSVPTISQSYPTRIAYTTNPNAGDTVAEYEVRFTTQHKGYMPRPSNNYGDSNYKLTRISSYYQNQEIQRINFGYDTNVAEEENRLTSIQISAPQANGLKYPAMTFTYEKRRVAYHDEKTHADEAWFLNQIRNGYGGLIDYNYATEWFSYSNDQLFQIVTHRLVKDEITGVSGTYSYHYGAFNMARNSAGGRQQHFGRFHGFGQVIVIDPAGNQTKHYFNNDTWHRDSNTASIMNGRPMETWSYAGDGTTLYNVSLKNWSYPNQSRVAGWPNADRNETHYLYVTEQNDYSCERKTTDGSNNRAYLNGCIRARSTFEQDVTFGQPTKRVDYAPNGSTPDRTILTGFVKNEAKWIFRQSYENIYTGGTPNRQTLQASTWYTYDNNANWNANNGNLGNRGQLSGLRQWAGGFDGALRHLDTIYQYDAYGNVSREIRRYNQGTATAYASAHSLDQVTQTEYEEGVRVRKITNPKNQRSEHRYLTNADKFFGNPSQTIDLNNQTTTFQYDTLGRLTKVRLPLESSSAWSFEAFYHNGTTFNSGNPYREQWRQHLSGSSYANTYAYYDGLGRRIQQRSQGDSAGQYLVSHVAYDGLGRMVRQGVPYSQNSSAYSAPNWGSGSTQTTYDPLSRVSVVTAPDNGQTRYYYALDINHYGHNYNPTNLHRVAVIDPKGHAKHQVSDRDGNLIRVRDFTGTGPWTFYGETQYTYDVRNNLTEVKDAANNLTRLTYDWLGRKTELNDPDMGRWLYFYDTFSNLTRQQDAKGQSTCFSYDPLNRLTAKRLGATTSCGGGEVVSYTYDQGSNGRGQRTGMTDSAGTVSYSYDARSRLTAETRTFNAGLGRNLGTYTTRTGYDLADRPTSMTYPDGEVVTTGYTLRSLPQSLQTNLSGQEYILSAGYNPLGQPTARTSGNNLTTNWAYYTAQQDNNRLKQLTLSGNRLNLQYWYDPAGNISRIDDTPQAESRTFTYDHLDRLTNVQGSKGRITFEDTFDSKNSSAWVWNSFQTVPHNENGNKVVRSRGQETGGWAGNFYRTSYDLTDGEGAELRFKVDQGNPFAHFSLEANNSPYLRFGVIAWKNRIDVQYNDDGAAWVYPKTLVSDLKPNTWYVVRLAVNDGGGGFLAEVYEEANPTVKNSYTRPMPVGKQWRFHHWIAYGNAYLDAYQEFDKNLSNSQTYAYNAIGNITRFNGRSYTYDSAHKHAVSSVSGLGSYSYDANGNQTERTTGGVTYIQTWTPENKLAGVTWPDQGISLSYDGDSNRLLKRAAGATTAYLGRHFEVTLPALAAGRHWGFESGSGEQAYDSSGYGQQGEVRGATWTDGYSGGQALNFDGVDDYVHFSEEPDITGELTVSAWVRPEQAPTGVGRVIAGSYHWAASAGNQRGWLLGRSYGNWDQLDFYIFGPDGAGVSTSLNGFFGSYQNQWVHVAGVYQPGQSVALYINGVKVSETTSNVPASIGLSGSFRIGARAQSHLQGNWDGQIDEVRLIASALDQTGVQALMQSQGGAVQVQPATLTKYYHFNGQRVAMRRGAEVHYLHGDHLGSTALSTNPAQATVSQARHYPFGAQRWTSGSTPTDIDFTGQRLEASFGLLDYNARYYDPAIGRFISADVIGVNPTDSQSLNRYSYVRNNPISRTDPSGHCDWCKQLWDDVQVWWALNNPFGGSVSGPLPIKKPTPPSMPSPADMMGPLMVDDSEAENLRRVNEIAERAEELAPLIDALGSNDPRVESNPERGRFDNSHPSYDDALQSARDNIGDFGSNTEKMYDPKTGTLIGERGDKRGWRIDNDHINWWDWTEGKKGEGGRYGHEFFPEVQSGPHSEYKGYAPWEEEEIPFDK